MVFRRHGLEVKANVQGFVKAVETTNTSDEHIEGALGGKPRLRQERERRRKKRKENDFWTKMPMAILRFD